MSYVRLTMSYIRLTMSYVRLTMSYIRLTMSYIRLTMSYIRLTMSYVYDLVGQKKLYVAALRFRKFRPIYLFIYCNIDILLEEVKTNTTFLKIIAKHGFTVKYTLLSKMFRLKFTVID